MRPTERDIEWAGWLGGAAVGWHWLSSEMSPSTMDPPAGGGGDALIGLGPLGALALVVTVSFTEEVLWRGYVVERLGAWIGPVTAAAIGLVIFTLGHLRFFGTGWLISVLPGAVLLYVLLLWRRNLWACTVCHFIGNVPVAIMAALA